MGALPPCENAAMTENTEPHWRNLDAVDAEEARAVVNDPQDGTGDEALDAFWNEASVRARFDSIGPYGGPTVLGSLRPPAWSYGSTPGQADAFVADLLDLGTETTTSAPLASYEAEGVSLPEVGAVSIVLDGANRPRVLVATSAVTDDGQTVTEHLTVLYPTKRHR